ncbi:restriction endonuclease subunit S [Mycoplasmopsis adleri]|uniref:restriction endonuclease subunit S n=1 Tax=Mycoplasmopsis adleri TaxID=51362 RepID=UPI0038736F6C
MLVRLGDLCDIKSSKRIFESEYVPIGIPFIRGQEVTNKTIFNSNTYNCYISKKRYEELKRNYGVPQKGDILITAVGTIGNLCYVDKEFEFYYKDGNLLQFTNFRDDFDSKYLYYFMHNDYFKKQLNNNLIGAVQKALTMVMLQKIKVPLIDLKSQRKIISILSSIDDHIERNNAMVQKLQVLALNSFDYFSKGIDGSNSVVLRDILIERDKSPIQVNNIVDSSGDIPFFTSGETILYTNEKLATGFNIFLSTGGNAKAQAYYGDVSYSTDTWCVTAKDNLQYYLYGYLKHIESQMDKLYFHGTGLKHLQKPIFLKSFINIPNEISLKKYNSIVEPIYMQISKIEQSIIKLQRLKNKLLALLINQQLV